MEALRIARFDAYDSHKTMSDKHFILPAKTTASSRDRDKNEDAA